MEKKEKGLLRRAVDSYGVPRLIITAFLLLMSVPLLAGS